MVPEEYEKVRSIFHRALDLKGEERERFLIEPCAETALLREEVANLLARDNAPRALVSRADTEQEDLTSKSGRHPGQVGPCKILGVLGKGTMGMGIVYPAEQREKIRRRVALRVIQHGMDSKEVLVKGRLDSGSRVPRPAADPRSRNRERVG